MNYVQGEMFNLVDILSIFRRQMRLLLLTVGVILAIAFIYLAKSTPLYTATTLILVDPAGKNVLTSEPVATSSASDNARLESEVEILKSDSLSIKTIRDSQIYLTDEFGVSLGLLDKIKAALGLEARPLPEGDEVLQATLSKFRDALDVRRRGLTYLISVSVTSESPERAASLANAHAKAYLDDQVASKVEASLRARDVLQSQLDQARQSLAASDGALTNYIQDHLDQLEDESDSDRISELRASLDEANREFTQLAETRDLARSALENNDWEQLAAQVNDASIARLAEQRRAFESRLAAAAEGSAEAIDITARLADLNEQLSSAGARRVSELERSVQAERESAAEITRSIRDEVLTSSLSPETLAEIYSLQQNAQIAQRQYDTLLSRLRELEIQALVQIADARVVSEALSPRNQSYPNTKLILALALVASLGLGGALALSNEYLFGGITSEDQLGNVIPAKVGAVVPKVTLGPGQITVADKVADEPMSQFAESFRKLRASIDRKAQAGQGRGKVILFTSSVPAEGKSTDALALARTYALAGKRTLLVDADLRKPSQHTFIDADPETGILEYLTGAITPGNKATFYESDPKSSLGIILGRRRSSIPTDAPLQSQAFSDMITNARQSFDVIIIDTAPLIPVVDARYIAPFADVTVLCVRYGLARQADVRAAYQLLEESMAGNSVVLTSLNCHEGKSAEYRYAGYYGYGTA